MCVPFDTAFDRKRTVVHETILCQHQMKPSLKKLCPKSWHDKSIPIGHLRSEPVIWQRRPAPRRTLFTPSICRTSLRVQMDAASRVRPVFVLKLGHHGGPVCRQWRDRESVRTSHSVLVHPGLGHNFGCLPCSHRTRTLVCARDRQQPSPCRGLPRLVSEPFQNRTH